jgi:hypothetical protein
MKPNSFRQIPEPRSASPAKTGVAKACRYDPGLNPTWMRHDTGPFRDASASSGYRPCKIDPIGIREPCFREKMLYSDLPYADDRGSRRPRTMDW